LDYKIFGITIRILGPEEQIIEIYKEGSTKPISEKSFNSLVNNIKSELDKEG
jgi:hypothetical protein